MVKGRLETAFTRGFTHLRGLKNLNFLLAHAGGLCLFSRELHSLGLNVDYAIALVGALLFMIFVKDHA